MSIVLAGTIITAGASMYGANKANKAQQNAANKNEQLSQAQLEEDKRRYDLDRQDKWNLFNAQMAGDEEMDQRNRADKERSYQRVRGDNINAINRGDKAGNQLSYRMGLGGTGTGVAGGLNERFKDFDFDFEADPGYKFRQSEGQTGVNNKFAQSGGLLSGAAMKALTRFNQDYASNEYSNSYGRARSGYESDRASYGAENMNEFNRLSGIQGAGQNAVNSVAGNSGTVTGQASNAMSGLANSLGQTSAQMGAASNNYYNNLMSNNNSIANASSAYQIGMGNSLAGGAGMLAAYYKKNNTPSYSYPTSNYGGYDYLDF